MTVKIKDPGSAITHYIGMMMSVLASTPLLIKASRQPDRIHMIALTIFIASMILLYAASTIYHTLDLSAKVNKRLKKLDHMMIFILIAGTYTPYILLSLRNIYGYLVLGFVWLLGIIGIIFNSINMHNKIVKIYSYIAYVLMGWCIIILLPMLLEALSMLEFIFLLLGGIAYTLGLIFYFGGSKFKWWHSVWHLFDLVGTILQFISLLLIVM